jgi:hypothetical protein
VPLLMLFPQFPPSLRGFSFERLKLSETELNVS